METSIQTAILCAGIVLFVFVAYGDVRTLRIPNMLVAAVAALGVLRLIVIGDLSTAVYTEGATVVILIVTFLLFWRGLFGGGDAKLLSATILLVGHTDLFSFLFIMSICGAVVTLAILIIQKCLPLYLGPRLAVCVPTARLSVPYGVAIATAAGVTLFFQSSVLSSLIR